VEKGESKDTKDGETSHSRKVPTTEEGSTTVAKTRPGKWGRLLGKATEINLSFSITIKLLIILIILIRVSVFQCFHNQRTIRIKIAEAD